jgi:hypothetical protein
MAGMTAASSDPADSVTSEVESEAGIESPADKRHKYRRQSSGVILDGGGSSSLFPHLQGTHQSGRITQPTS